jgi:hypothetical protein
VVAGAGFELTALRVAGKNYTRGRNKHFSVLSLLQSVTNFKVIVIIGHLWPQYAERL